MKKFTKQELEVFKNPYLYAYLGLFVAAMILLGQKVELTPASVMMCLGLYGMLTYVVLVYSVMIYAKIINRRNARQEVGQK